MKHPGQRKSTTSQMEYGSENHHFGPKILSVDPF